MKSVNAFTPTVVEKTSSRQNHVSDKLKNFVGKNERHSLKSIDNASVKRSRAERSAKNTKNAYNGRYVSDHALPRSERTVGQKTVRNSSITLNGTSGSCSGSGDGFTSSSCGSGGSSTRPGVLSLSIVDPFYHIVAELYTAQVDHF